MLIDGELHCCSRNQSVLDDGASFYWSIARQFQIETALRASPTFAVQGEIVGPGVQRNPLGLAEKSLRVFNPCFAHQARSASSSRERPFAMSKMLIAVPIVHQGEAFDESVASVLQMAEGLYEGTSNEREGIVVRPRRERFSEALNGRLSFKAISNRLLLKEA